MNREALEQTIRVLQDVIKYRLGFNLQTFVGWDQVDEFDHKWNWALSRDSKAAERFSAAMEKEQFLLIPHNCGCTACATGYAGLDPWFNQHGFVTTKEGRVMFHGPDGLVKDWGGMRAFYDLSEDEARYLFMPDDYERPDDPQLVIDRIREVLKNEFPKDVYPEEDEDA